LRSFFARRLALESLEVLESLDSSSSSERARLRSSSAIGLAPK